MCVLARTGPHGRGRSPLSCAVNVDFRKHLLYTHTTLTCHTRRNFGPYSVVILLKYQL